MIAVGGILKIVLSTDWHLKFASPFDKLTDNGLPSRLEEIIESVKWVVATGKQHKAQYFIGCGDIFDSPEKLQTKEGIAIHEMFKHISDQFPKKTYFIAGNHDMISANHNILELFAPLVKVFSTASIVDIEGARLYFLPYLRETEDIKQQLIKFKQDFDTPGKKYLFAHFWDNSVMSLDNEAIDLSTVDTDFFDRIFLGHFHVPTANKDSKVVYLGTLLNKRFNESGKKGCWILDTKTNSLEFFENPYSPDFHAIMDTAVIGNPEVISKNAYYRVACSPENVLTVTKLLAHCKGFEIMSKQEDLEQGTISLLHVEKKNSKSLKDYIITNCDAFLPEGIDIKEFKQRGEQFMVGL